MVVYLCSLCMCIYIGGVYSWQQHHSVSISHNVKDWSNATSKHYWQSVPIRGFRDTNIMRVYKINSERKGFSHHLVRICTGTICHNSVCLLCCSSTLYTLPSEVTSSYIKIFFYLAAFVDREIMLSECRDCTVQPLYVNDEVSERFKG